MGILLPHEMHNVVHLIGGHHGVKQIHFLVTVTSHRVHTGYAVSVLFDVLVYDSGALVVVICSVTRSYL